jgi:hypothetical protein
MQVQYAQMQSARIKPAKVTLRLTLAPILLLAQVFRESGPLGTYNFTKEQYLKVLYDEYNNRLHCYIYNAMIQIQYHFLQDYYANNLIAD